MFVDFVVFVDFFFRFFGVVFLVLLSVEVPCAHVTIAAPVNMLKASATNPNFFIEKLLVLHYTPVLLKIKSNF